MRQDDDLDFESIQKIFAQRDEERRRQEEDVSLKVPKASASSAPVYKKTELRSEPKYNNMHAKNINITPKGRKKAKNNNLVLVAGVVIAVTIGAIAYGNHQANQVPQEETRIVYMDEKYQQTSEDVINPENCDFSNLTIILRESTTNTNKVVDVADQELTELGVDARRIDSDDDMISLISNIKSNDQDREIIVINVDGVTNKGSDESVIMTNYSNSAKSADVLAMAIYNANEDIYGISSDLRCGKKDLTNGKRTKTSVEVMLSDAGYTDVACLTIAPASSYLDTEINVNNLATSIAEGVIRLASLPVEERYDDLIRRVEFGDTISQYAVDNDVSESYIRSTNSETLSYSNGNLQYDSAIIVSTIPKNLTSKVSVQNASITTNPNDISTKVSYYVVEENDTVSAISEKLNVKASDLVVPSGDIDVIKVGDKIGYEKTEGPILVNKTAEITK